MTMQLLSGSLQLIDVRAEMTRLFSQIAGDLLVSSRVAPTDDCATTTTSLLAVEAQILNGSVKVQRAALLPCTPEILRNLRQRHSTLSSDAPTDVGSADPSQQHGLRQSQEKPTVRELKVLALVREGRRNREIAEVLHISEDTVKTRMKSAMAKLSASNRTHAVTIATERGWLDLSRQHVATC